MAWEATVRRVARARLALAGAGVLTVLAAAPAAAVAPAAAEVRQASATAVTSPASLEVTSVSPGFATSRGTVTVSGFITNTTTAPISGVTIQLWSSSRRLTSRAEMSEYLGVASSAGIYDTPVNGAEVSLPALAAHATTKWSISLRASQVGMTQFGVYPLAAQASVGGVPVVNGHVRTFLPFYPPQPAHPSLQQLRIAWVWPLIATPQQAVCRALLSNTLAGSIAPTGRLGRLLAAGAGSSGHRSQVTWAIDPALLSSAVAMTSPYRVGGTPTCGGGTPEPASTAARNWLAQLRAVVARQDFFVTPYADVDVAALSHQGLDSELASAFSSGRATASQVLGTAQRPAPAGTGSGTATGSATRRRNAAGLHPPSRPGWIAWPANGIADYGVLGSLAVNGVGTVVLDGSMMPPTTPPLFTPSGVTTTTTGVGTKLNVLLTDDGLDQIVASAGARPPATGSPARVSAAAADFASEQQFLAQTAMIVSESPTTARSVIVVPPRRWDPPSGVASALLATSQAPWLKPVSLAALAGSKQAAGQVPRQQPPQTPIRGKELRPSLLQQIRKLDSQIQLHASIFTSRPPHYLSAAVAAVESSAWDGSRAGTRQARALLQRIQAYLASQQRALTVVDPPRITLGGKSGSVPVSIDNRLRQSVTVTLKITAASPNRIVFGNFNHLVTVAAGKQRIIKIPVHSAVAGSTVLSIQLCTRDGTPLPGASATMTVEATRFGTLALVIIGIAFGVFVLTSVGRAIRRGRDSDPADLAVGGVDMGPAGTDPGGAAATGGPGEDLRNRPNPPDWPGGPATVGTVQDERQPEEPDEHASARGRAEPH